ncbi:GNAT family acetyltransferase [Occultella gossypii]|uniref:GNAT family acetyltransferase n=1 Tax=Occultella gossypii TaxID=2800820 RepID=A0ABS7SBM7_9MICO|nr:GNAT family acetyltransferase [Occultella gossypii]MBZ2197745.1 GNAT family acetyltransferase [Occultella gossypii]
MSASDASADARQPGPQPAVREALDADSERIIELWHACGLTRPWNDPATDLGQARVGETSTVLVLETPDGVAGTVMVGLDGHRGWVYYLAVDPVQRGLGHGRRLMVAAEAWLLGEGARKVQLMVREGNDVNGFYEALGYADQGTQVLGRWLEEPAERPQN